MPDAPPAVPDRDPWLRRVRRSLTKPQQVSRWLFVVLMLLAVQAMNPLFDRLPYIGADVGDPKSVYVHDLDHPIDPKAAIRDQCASAVESIGHVDGFVTVQGETFERWSVHPKPGHVDRVLLSFRTGKVVCP